VSANKRRLPAKCKEILLVSRDENQQTLTMEFFKEDMQARRKKMKIRPLQDRLIVKRLEEEEKTKGGIIIPDAAKEKPMQGEVIAVGKGKITDEGKALPLDVKAGDRILFGKYAGTEIKIDGEEYLIMREDDVLGVLE